MAAGYKDFTAGSALTAADLEDYCELQSVMQFASEAARDSALTSVKTNGTQAYTTDLSRHWRYNGTAWVLAGWSATAGRPGVALTDAAQSINNITITDITWGTEVSDVDGWTSGASATLTVPTGWGGIYAITYQGEWAAGAGTTSYVLGYLNGTATWQGSGLLSRPGITVVRPLAAGDTLKFTAYQDSGGAVNIVSRVDISWIGV